MKPNKQKMIHLEGIMHTLAQGKDPTSGVSFPEDTILNNTVLKDAFQEVSEVLKYFIAPDESSRKRYKSPFFLSQEASYSIALSDEPISVSKLTWSINAAVNDPSIRRLKATEITYWLTLQGFLELHQADDGNTYKMATEIGTALGISSTIKANSAGSEYALNLYSKEAQMFIIRHINLITECSLSGQ